VVNYKFKQVLQRINTGFYERGEGGSGNCTIFMVSFKARPEGWAQWLMPIILAIQIRRIMV
jgi:hypothetical protein